LKELST